MLSTLNNKINPQSKSEKALRLIDNMNEEIFQLKLLATKKLCEKMLTPHMANLLLKPTKMQLFAYNL